MTDNEILKVAECCIQSQSKADCFRLDCPAATAGCDNCRIWELTDDDSDNAVLNQIIKELVTVINRKNADIEELKSTCDKERADRLYLSHQNKAIIAGQETLQKALAEKIAELERFKKIETAVNDFWGEMQKLATFKKKRNPTLEELLEYMDNLKVEIIKQFAVRLKSLLAVNGQVSNEEYYYITTDIDNLAKEMEGDAK